MTMTPIAYRNNGLWFSASAAVGLHIATDAQAEPSATPFFNGDILTAGGYIEVSGRSFYTGKTGALIVNSGDTRGWGIGCNMVSAASRLIWCLANTGGAAGRMAVSCAAPLNRWFDWKITHNPNLGTTQMLIDDVNQDATGANTQSSDGTATLGLDGTETNANAAVTCYACANSANVMTNVAASRSTITGAAGNWTETAGGSYWVGGQAWLRVIHTNAANTDAINILELPLAPGYGYGTRPTDASGLNTNIKWLNTTGVLGAGVTAPPTGSSWRNFNIARFFAAGVL